MFLKVVHLMCSFAFRSSGGGWPHLFNGWTRYEPRTGHHDKANGQKIRNECEKSAEWATRSKRKCRKSGNHCTNCVKKKPKLDCEGLNWKINSNMIVRTTSKSGDERVRRAGQIVGSGIGAQHAEQLNRSIETEAGNQCQSVQRPMTHLSAQHSLYGHQECTSRTKTGKCGTQHVLRTAKSSDRSRRLPGSDPISQHTDH